MDNKASHLPHWALGALVALGAVSPGPFAAGDAMLAPVRIESGLVAGAGLGERNEIHVYRGVPFAAPPVGAFRWKPPRPVTPWAGVRMCTEFGPWCPQPKPMLGRELGGMSEDCLYLNVWTPARAPTERLAVMVWIHGGGCTTGSGAMAAYDGETLARQGVVAVTINYRLGPFGFFAHPLLSQESEHGVSGNYGLLDQLAALQWVQRNIAAFGGDPDCVTIFGESAGALSACRLLVSPLATGLFHRAIAQSGGPHGRNRHLRAEWYGMESMEHLGERIAQKLGCDKAPDPVAALRAKSGEEVLAAADASQGLFGKGNKFSPIIDGWVLPEDPGDVFDAGRQHRVPLIAGSNADEGTVFLRQLPVKGVLGYRLAVRTLFDGRAPEVLRLFPAARDAEVPAALDKLVTVSSFVVQARYLARSMANADTEAFLYHFTHVPAVSRSGERGAFHGIEIPYIFGSLQKAWGVRLPAEEPLSKTISACWVQFAKTGNPNGAGLPEWPRYQPDSDEYLEFGDPVEAKSGLYREACDLFDEIQAERRRNR